MLRKIGEMLKKMGAGKQNTDHGDSAEDEERKEALVFACLVVTCI
jgi:hypothetical protein